MTTQDYAILAFVKDNAKAVAIAAVSVLALTFICSHWHSNYACDKLPSMLGVFSCHLGN